jgi:hypothetical protein
MRWQVRLAVHSKVAAQSAFARHATQRLFEHLGAARLLRQSVSSTHCTHDPLPLHTPPAHDWCAAVGVMPQRAELVLHVAVWQTALGAGQSAGTVHCTHWPAPVHFGVALGHAVRVRFWPRVSQASTMLPLQARRFGEHMSHSPFV